MSSTVVGIKPAFCILKMLVTIRSAKTSAPNTSRSKGMKKAHQNQLKSAKALACSSVKRIFLPLQEERVKDGGTHDLFPPSFQKATFLSAAMWFHNVATDIIILW